MRRTRSSLAAALAVVGAACGVLSIEEQILADFFRAARLRDTTMMARVSAVDFNPRTDGIVDRFEIAGTHAGATKDARVLVLDARVRRLDGSSDDRRLTVTLQRGPDGRWRIVELTG